MLVILGLAQACRKESLNQPEEPTAALSTAIDRYLATVLPDQTILTSLLAGARPRTLKILPERRRIFVRGDSTVVEIGISESVRHGIRFTTDSLPAGSASSNTLTRLLLIQTKGTFRSYLMTVIADDGISLKNGDLEQVHLLDKPAAFNGVVLFSKLSGSYVNAFLYRSGIPVTRLGTPVSPTGSSKAGGAARVQSEPCGYHYFIYWHTDCGDGSNVTASIKGTCPMIIDGVEKFPIYNGCGGGGQDFGTFTNFRGYDGPGEGTSSYGYPGGNPVEADPDPYSGDEPGEFFDDNTEDHDAREHIPSAVVLSNGNQVSIQFGTTASDGLSANQPVSTRLVQGLQQALEYASWHGSGPAIQSISIKATTNGLHGPNSNHYKGIGMDISKINGIYINDLPANHPLILRLQNAFESLPEIRENFGPAFVHKLKSDYGHMGVPPHLDHIHISINGN